MHGICFLSYGWQLNNFLDGSEQCIPEISMIAKPSSCRHAFADCLELFLPRVSFIGSGPLKLVLIFRSAAFHQGQHCNQRTVSFSTMFGTMVNFVLQAGI